MKQFNAAHLEIKKSFAEGFETHPYEVGWADEVIFFVYIEDFIGIFPFLFFCGDNPLFPAKREKPT